MPVVWGISRSEPEKSGGRHEARGSREEPTADLRRASALIGPSRMRLGDSATIGRVLFTCAGVAKLADAQDLKSWVPQGACGFDPRPRHQMLQRFRRCERSDAVFMAAQMDRANTGLTHSYCLTESHDIDAPQTTRVAGRCRRFSSGKVAVVFTLTTSQSGGDAKSRVSAFGFNGVRGAIAESLS